MRREGIRELLAGAVEPAETLEQARDVARSAAIAPKLLSGAQRRSVAWSRSQPAS